MSRTARELARLLVKLGLIDDGEAVIIRRTRSGLHQRAMGAWSWWADRDYDEAKASGKPVEICGSQWPAKEVIRHARRGMLLSVYRDGWNSISLIPENLPAGEPTSDDAREGLRAGDEGRQSPDRDA